ncbi:MAG: hypothetical protein M3Y55_02325 [Pseudomonadota bacterium]|nr:hypothetical protein [Pseudomonadota bacterium]
MLFNEVSASNKEALSTTALASWLGESPSAFDWSHFGRVPLPLRFLVHPFFRICPACAAAGYHSALLSLRLLQECPIHHCQLVERCHCGARFMGEVNARALGHVGYCHCGRTAFFTRETCRRPTMSVAETHSMRPVAAWLERLASVGRPRFEHAARQRDDTRLFNEWLAAWCENLGLGYPACFVALTSKTPWQITLARTPAAPLLLGSPARRRAFAQVHTVHDRRTAGGFWTERYWTDSAATRAYRSTARYLRRHVTRGAERRAMDFIQHPDPLRMAREMGSSRSARMAFADLLWTAWMELNAPRRRWPYRPVERAFLGGPLFVGRIDTPQGRWGLERNPQLSNAGQAWVDSHACEAVMVERWRHIQSLTALAIRSGIADWRWGPQECSSWSTTLSEETLKFVGMTNVNGAGIGACALGLPDKAARQAAWHNSAASRHRQVLDTCVGPCLTWGARDGWVVTEAARPDPLSIKRHRLLGVRGERPPFWLFRHDGVFFARACNLKVQAAGDSAREAIDCLRKAIVQHRRHYPIAPAATPALVAPRGLESHSWRQYDLELRCAVRENGFWRGAGRFYSAAMQFLDAHESPQVVESTVL